MLCSNDWEANVGAILQEMTRVLTMNGNILITSHMEFESEEFQSILTDILGPILGSDRTRMWTLEVHRMLRSDEAQQMATVYVLRSKPRRFTRSMIDENADPLPLQIKLMSYDDDDM